MTTTTYRANNSGGSWWLQDKDWLALEQAGWVVELVKDNENYTSWRVISPDGRYYGALAVEATREGLSFRDAIAEWEAVTGEQANALGCSCCGSPHSFSSDEGDYYTPEYPMYGERY